MESFEPTHDATDHDALRRDPSGRDTTGRDAIELSVLERLHERAHQELRDAYAEARRIRNEALDQADELWLRTYENAQRQAALLLEEARLRAKAAAAAAEASALEPLAKVVSLRPVPRTRLEPPPPAPRPVPPPPPPPPSSPPVRPPVRPSPPPRVLELSPPEAAAQRVPVRLAPAPARVATPTLLIPSVVLASVVAALVGVFVPVAGVAVAAVLVVVLVHATTKPADETVVRALLLTPVVVMARLALPVAGLSRAGFMLAVAAVGVLAALPLEPVQRGEHARADVGLLLRSVPFLAVAAVGARFDAASAAAGAVGGACLLALVATPTARMMRQRVVHPLAAAGFTALLVAAAAGATQPTTALAVVGIGALVDRHLASGGRMWVRAGLGVVFGSIVGCAPW